MQFRLSTLLLAMVVFGTSLSLAGPCGIALAVYVVLLVGLTRACLSGSAGIGGACLVWLIGIGLPVLLMPMISVAGPAARRCQCANNLKQIALGLQNYGDKCGCLPPPYVPDKNGKPMHSWRVLVLPYIEQGSLYQAYRFDEPWDGPNNSKLAAAANYAYVCSGDRTTSVQGQTATNYVAVTGKGTAWSSSKLSLSGKLMDDHKILLVEVENSGINWMEPKDLTVDQAIAGLTSKSGPRISSGHDPRLANAVLADGELVELPTDLSPELLRVALTEDISHLYKHVPKEQIEAMRWELFDDYPYLWWRLAVWIASVVILLVHGVRYDNRKRMQEKAPTVGG